MERLQLAAPPAPLSMSVPNESGYVPGNPSAGAGYANGSGNLVEFLSGLGGPDGLPNGSSTSSVVGSSLSVSGTSEEEVLHAPSYYDQTITPSVMMPQQQPSQAAHDLAGIHDDGSGNASEYPWMKDKKVARKNQRNYQQLYTPSSVPALAFVLLYIRTTRAGPYDSKAILIHHVWRSAGEKASQSNRSRANRSTSKKSLTSSLPSNSFSAVKPED